MYLENLYDREKYRRQDFPERHTVSRAEQLRVKSVRSAGSWLESSYEAKSTGWIIPWKNSADFDWQAYWKHSSKAYPEQIQKLYHLVEELETLQDAKQIIENYKAEYQQYLGDVPDFIMKEDEAGFYSRLGFATINESVLTVEYKFSYTSGGGMAQRSFTVPMTEETIAELIKVLESKLTATAFAKE